LFITRAERQVLLLKKRLQTVLDELTEVVNKEWSLNKTNEVLGRANLSLTIAGGSLQNEVALLGPFVLGAVNVYWNSRSLIDEDEEQAVRQLGDERIEQLLNEAKELDQRIRAATKRA